MANKQTRRSISINRQLYDAAKLYAEETGTALSKLTEAALRQVVPVLEPRMATPAILSAAGRIEDILARALGSDVANKLDPSVWNTMLVQVIQAAQQPPKIKPSRVDEAPRRG